LDCGYEIYGKGLHIRSNGQSCLHKKAIDVALTYK
jgi:hypothetical protein